MIYFPKYKIYCIYILNIRFIREPLGRFTYVMTYWQHHEISSVQQKIRSPTCSGRNWISLPFLYQLIVYYAVCFNTNTWWMCSMINYNDTGWYTSWNIIGIVNYNIGLRRVIMQCSFTNRVQERVIVAVS